MRNSGGTTVFYRPEALASGRFDFVQATSVEREKFDYTGELR